MYTIETDASNINNKSINQPAWESIQKACAMFDDCIYAEVWFLIETQGFTLDNIGA